MAVQTCECLHCSKVASARLTAPQLKARHFICDEHLSDALKWAAPYRNQPGSVVVENYPA